MKIDVVGLVVVAVGMFGGLAGRAEAPARVERPTVVREAHIVDVTTLGVKNDGSADVSAIVNAATEKSALYFPPGSYLVEQPLRIRHSIYGKGFSRAPYTVRGANNLDATRTWFISKIECNDETKSIVEFGEQRNINVEEINFMCHSQEFAIKVLPGKPGNYAFLSKIGIYQLGGTGISIECQGSRPIFVQDICIWGSTKRYYEKSRGILVCAWDCRLSNIEVMAAQIGLEVRAGYTYGENMHLWTGCMAKEGDKAKWWKGTRALKCCSGTHFVGSNIYPDTSYHPFELTGQSAIVDIRGIMYWDDRSEHGCADHDGALVKCDGVEDPCVKIDGGFWGVCGSDADPHWMKYLYNPKIDVRNVTVRSQMDIKGANLDTLCMNTDLPDYRVAYSTNAFCKIGEIFTTAETGVCEAEFTLDDGAAWKLAFLKEAGAAATMTATPLNGLCAGREIRSAAGDGTLKVFLKAGPAFAGRFTTTRMTPRFRPVDFGHLRTHSGAVRYRECRDMPSVPAAAVPSAAGLEKIVFLEAHPDDLASEMGTALLMQGRYEVHVVDYTHGERGCGAEKFTNGWTRATRTAEETRVCAAVGAKLHWLEEIDGEAYAERKTVAQLADLLKEIRPRAVIMHWPMDTHDDHVMSFAAGLKAISLSGLEPEVYFHLQESQARGFRPFVYVDVTSVLDRKNEIIGFYACQDGDKMAERKTKTQWVGARAVRGWKGGYCEEFGVMPGTVRPDRCVFAALPGASF